jgi:hypothetical protein
MSPAGPASRRRQHAATIIVRRTRYGLCARRSPRLSMVMIVTETSSIHYGVIFGTIAAFITAAASVALVVVAILFREEVRAARRRPRLHLLFDIASATDCIIIQADSKEEYWVRFSAHNEVGKDAAVGGQLLLLDAKREDGTQQHAVPSRPFHVTDGADSARVDIPGGIERRFDIFHLERESTDGAQSSVTAALVLALKPQSNVHRDHLAPGRYTLTMALTADNSDATYWQVDLLFKKQWLPGDTLNDSVEVSIPARVTIN